MKLKACPFCGNLSVESLPHSDDPETEFFVYCYSCSARGPICETQIESEIQWGQRYKQEEANAIKL